ncbi:MAG: hypothetical protein QM658_13530, partial [Gordonia sp. (in: high G+C Gram-positive bacteria)]
DEVWHRLPGRAGFTRADVEDARRRAPDPAHDWRSYAASRRLDHVGSQNAAGYLTALPLDPRLQWNVMRGVFGGRHLALFHELYALPVDRDGEPNDPAQLYSVVFDPGLRRNRGIVFDKDDPDPTYIEALGVPTSAGSTNVPAAGLLRSGMLTIRNQPGSGGWGPDKRVGLGGPWRMEGPDLDPVVMDRLTAGPLPGLLAELSGVPWVRISIEFGNVKLARSSFVVTDDEWDRLAAWTVALGDAVEQAVLPLTAPQPFGEPLPPRPAGAVGTDHILAGPPSPWAEQLDALASGLSLVIEDPYSYHRAFPGVPVPGRAFAVQRGRVGDSAPTGRVVFTEDRSIWRRNDGYNAILLPARAGAAPTPPGGVRRTDGATYFVGDGLFALWRRRSGAQVHLGDVPALAAQSLAVGRELDVLAE